MSNEPRKRPSPDADGDDAIATAFNGPTDGVHEPYVRVVPPEGIDGDETGATGMDDATHEAVSGQDDSDAKS